MPPSESGRNSSGNDAGSSGVTDIPPVLGRTKLSPSISTSRGRTPRVAPVSPQRGLPVAPDFIARKYFRFVVVTRARYQNAPLSLATRPNSKPFAFVATARWIGSRLLADDRSAMFAVSTPLPPPRLSLSYRVAVRHALSAPRRCAALTQATVTTGVSVSLRGLGFSAPDTIRTYAAVAASFEGAALPPFVRRELEGYLGG